MSCCCSKYIDIGCISSCGTISFDYYAFIPGTHTLEVRLMNNKVKTYEAEFGQYLENQDFAGDPLTDWIWDGAPSGLGQISGDPCVFDAGSQNIYQVATIPDGVYRVYYSTISATTGGSELSLTVDGPPATSSPKTIYSNNDIQNISYTDVTFTDVSATNLNLGFGHVPAGNTVTVNYVRVMQKMTFQANRLNENKVLDMRIKQPDGTYFDFGDGITCAKIKTGIYYSL